MNSRFMQIYKQGGVYALLGKIFNVIIRASMEASRDIYFKITPAGSFSFNGNKLKYFRHNFNLAFQNERTVEMAIVLWFLEHYGSAGRVLEVGNVLGNYGCKVSRDVLDKYDSSPNIINEDVVSFSPTEKFNTIVSISTLEHVGWDEAIKDPEKIPAAIKNLKANCLAKGGVMLVTLPLGYNDFFDKFLKNGEDVFTEKYFLKRISSSNKWQQVEYLDVAESKFGTPFNNANAMFIGVVRN